ncbi:MAG: ribonuclease E/G, partial [Planctomycetaceae bacterium]|nr:ribonuclease E/G [Planctomycetaceae bacterium]
MLVNVRQPEECRIAIIENSQLEELYVERTTHDNYAGNIYKGVVVNLEPSIQAVFVDFGVGRNGFLHISDVEPCYFRQVPGWADREQNETATRDDRNNNQPPNRINFHEDSYNRPRIKPPIQDIFRRGDEVLVQVIKEGLGNKGPTLSTYISIPGRYLVLMPSLGRVGISRKIDDELVRRRLKDMMRDLKPPKGLGFIVRTAGADRTQKELSRDLAYLMRLWKVIVRRVKNMPAPIDIYEESDMIIRTIRDIFSSEIDTIYVDEESSYERAKEFLQFVMPRYTERLQLYSGKEPIFHKFGMDKEIT